VTAKVLDRNTKPNQEAKSSNIIDDYKYSDAANLAHFYAGVCYKNGCFYCAQQGL
jgi:hypothetical protein